MTGFFKRTFPLLAIIAFALPAYVAQAQTKDNPAPLSPTEVQKLQERADELANKPGVKKATVIEEIAPQVPATEKTVDFTQFDANGDGTLSRDEVGEKLFRLFDHDGNMVIDNIEMEKPTVIVFTPMERKMIEILDYQDSHTPEKETVSVAEFLQASNLAKFDKDEDGLSPLDFLGKTFNQVDVIDDKVIDLYEWKRAYAESLRPKHMESFNYNNE